VSVRSHGTTRLPLDGFSRNLIFTWFFFRKSVEKIQVPLKFDKNNRYIPWSSIYLIDYTSLSFSKNKYLLKSWREKQNTHFVFNNIFFLRKSCLLWDNVEKYCKAGQDNIAHARCRLYTKGYRHTLRICYTYCFSTTTMLMWTLLNAKVIRTLSVLFSLSGQLKYVEIYSLRTAVLRWLTRPDIFLHVP